MTVHKALHSRDDIDRLYVSRKERGQVQDSVNTSIQRLHKKSLKKTNHSN